MQEVESGTIESVGYEGDTLHVKFMGGKSYKYPRVPEDQYKRMLEADSPGGYFRKHIAGKYRHSA